MKETAWLMARRTDMEDILRAVYNSHTAALWLKVLSTAVTLLSVAAFFGLVFYFWRDSFLELLRFLLITGAPFALVTLLRRLINAPRPFELYPFYILPPREERGRSFPSRHAFSVFSIGTVLCFANFWLGAALLLLGALMCVARVLLGIHFIRDVAAGAVIGAVTSIIGVLTASLF